MRAYLDAVLCPDCGVQMSREFVDGRFVLVCRNQSPRTSIVCPYLGVLFAAPTIELEHAGESGFVPTIAYKPGELVETVSDGVQRVADNGQSKLFGRPLIVFDGDCWQVRRVLSAGTHTFVTNGEDVAKLRTLVEVARWLIAGDVSVPVAESPVGPQMPEQTSRVSSGSKRRRR